MEFLLLSRRRSPSRNVPQWWQARRNVCRSQARLHHAGRSFFCKQKMKQETSALRLWKFKYPEPLCLSSAVNVCVQGTHFQKNWWKKYTNLIISWHLNYQQREKPIFTDVIIIIAIIFMNTEHKWSEVLLYLFSLQKSRPLEYLCCELQKLECLVFLPTTKGEVLYQSLAKKPWT